MSEQDILALALSTLKSMGAMPIITAMLVVALVGGFIGVAFNRNK